MSLTVPRNKNTVASDNSSLKPDLVWIEPGFAVGSKPYDYRPRAVSQFGIAAVVALYEPTEGDAEAWQVHGVRLYWVPMRDWVQIPVTHFDRVVEAVSTGLNSGTPVLLHCLAGINRAPTFAAAVLCQIRGMNVDSALAVVKSRRVSAKPSFEQENSLRLPATSSRWEWEAGDSVYIPPNTVHQHFNLDPEQPLRFISAESRMIRFMGMDDLEQLEDAPEFQNGPGE